MLFNEQFRFLIASTRGERFTSAFSIAAITTSALLLTLRNPMCVNAAPDSPSDVQPEEKSATVQTDKNKISREQQAELVAEQAAIGAIKRLGGWVKTEKIDGHDRVVEVNMIYHMDDLRGRQENKLQSPESLTHLPKFPYLRLLLLQGKQVTDEGLAELRGMKHLEKILLGGPSDITDAGVAHLAHVPNLKYLNINKAKITDESLKLLNRLPKLETIGMQDNNFTEKGLEYLRDMTQLKSLWLGTGDNQITDAGLAHLAKLTSLENLQLSNSKISDVGLNHVRGMRMLKHLCLGMTASGLEEMSRLLPEAHVQSFPEQ